MCYDAQSSIQSYGLVTLLSGLLLYYGDQMDKHIAIAFLGVVQMQLAEFLMWSDQSCGWVNQYATYFAYLAILAQPLCVLLGGYYFKSFTGTVQKYILTIAMGIALFWITEFAYYALNARNVCSTPKNGHLYWDFLRKKEFYPSMFIHILYFAGFMIPWLFTKDKVRGLFFLGLLVYSFITHYMEYKDQWHTMWCFGVRTGILSYILFSVVYRIMNK